MALLGRIDPIGDRVAMKRGMLTDIGPAARRVAGRRCGRAFTREILPGTVSGERREVPLAAFEMLQDDIACLYLARWSGSAQRFQELLAVTGNRALNDDDIHVGRRSRRSRDPHLFRELTPGRSADERIVVPRVEGCASVGGGVVVVTSAFEPRCWMTT